MTNHPTLININTGGRLGNHLYTHAWLMQISIMTGAIVYNPGFKPYQDWFEGPASQLLPTYSSSFARSNRFIERLVSQTFVYYGLKLYHHFRIVNQYRLDELRHTCLHILCNHLGLGYIAFDWLVTGRHLQAPLGPTFRHLDGSPDFYSAQLLRYIKSKRIVLIDSVAVAPLSSSGIKDDLRAYFKPTKVFVDKASILLKNLRSQSDLVIGVAIRKGDFKTWLGGKWYVNDQAFKNIIETAIHQFSPRICSFAFCSDEDIDEMLTGNLFSIVIPPSPPLHLSVLMGCDYIIGTAQSTFIEWSSFLGDVPLHSISPGKYGKSNELDFKVFGIERTV